jgi:hypothetical protein
VQPAKNQENHIVKMTCIPLHLENFVKDNKTVADLESRGRRPSLFATNFQNNGKCKTHDANFFLFFYFHFLKLLDPSLINDFYIVKFLRAKACVTNPTATGRFLVVGGFTGLPLIFPHRAGAVQN